jgi:hypothetical protein
MGGTGWRIFKHNITKEVEVANKSSGNYWYNRKVNTRIKSV